MLVVAASFMDGGSVDPGRVAKCSLAEGKAPAVGGAVQDLGSAAVACCAFQAIRRHLRSRSGRNSVSGAGGVRDEVGRPQRSHRPSEGALAAAPGAHGLELLATRSPCRCGVVRDACRPQLGHLCAISPLQAEGCRRWCPQHDQRAPALWAWLQRSAHSRGSL